MKNHTTDAEIVGALRLIEQYKTASAASRASGIPVSTLKERRNLAEGRGLTVQSIVRTEADRLRDENTQLKADIKRLQKEEETAEKVRERMFNLAARTPAPATWVATKRRADSHKEVPMLFASDWHWGEVVNPVDMAGVNAFDSHIARDRARLFFDTAVRLIHRDGPDVPGVVLALGGDMVTGTIHEELLETNDVTTTEAVYDLTDVIIAGIDKLVEEFKRVYVPCVVGNHGRDGKKPQYKRKVFHSYEWLLYTTLERHYRGNPNVVFFIPGEADAFFKVNGKRFLLTHGDNLGVKGGDGIIGALGPIMRGTVKLGVSEAQIGRDFDYLMMGHWHFPLYLPRTLVNGTLKGYDEFARLALRVPYAPASQLLWRVHPVHGLTSRREIILQEPLVLADNKEWVTWPKMAMR